MSNTALPTMVDFAGLKSYIVFRSTGEDVVKQVPLVQNAQKRTAELLKPTLPIFFSDSVEQVAFDPTFSTDEESVMKIAGFDLPDYIKSVLDTPEDVANFTSSDNMRNAKILFHVDSTKTVYFQCWRNFALFSNNRLSLLLRQGAFDVNTSTSLVVDGKVDVIYFDGDLFFKSYATANAVMSLLDYVTEATRDEVNDFVGHRSITGDASLADDCNSVQRKLIKSINSKGFLDLIDVNDLKQTADEHGISLTIENGKVVLPEKGPELTKVLRFLNDQVYKGPISGDTLLSNSSRRL